MIKPIDLANLIINKKIDLNKPPLIKTATETVDLKIIKQVIKENSDAVAKYKAGKTSVIGFLVGQVMRLTKGKSNPQEIQKLIIKEIHD